MWVSSFVFKSEFILTGRHGKWVIMNHKILYCIFKIVLKFPSEFPFTFRLSGHLWMYTPAPHRSYSGVWPVCKCRLGRCLKSSEAHLWSKEILCILCFLFLTVVNLFCKYPLLLLPLPPTSSPLMLWSKVRVLFLPSTHAGAGMPGLQSWLSLSMPQFPPLEDNAQFIGYCLVEWVDNM